MYIYNITTNVASEISDEWLVWMKQTFIPAMLATRKFTKALLTNVLIEEEMGGITYSTQYFTESKEMLNAFFEENKEDISITHTKFKGQYVDFSTELKVVTELK